MRNALSLGILALLATASQARAGDFTGGYAGVNAGYGFERGRDARKPGALPNSGSAAIPSNDLPPSAAVAAKSVPASRSATQR